MARFRDFQLLAAAVLGALGAGCGQSAGIATDADAQAGVIAEPSQPRVVIAIIDSGINPYHEYFNASDSRFTSPIYPPGSPPSAVTPDVLEEFGIDPSHILRVRRTGDAAADRAADAGLWARVKPGEPYWFQGTNIIAVGRRAGGLAATPETGPLILPKDDEDAHGVAVVASLLAANPEAIVYFVQHNNDETSTDMGSEDAHRIGFLHPAVDLISTSYVRIVQPEAKTFFGSFTAVVEMGKLHFSAAHSQPLATFTQGGAGPWWSIGVSGVGEGETSGRTATGYFPDFVADAYQVLPHCAACETGGLGERAGTSFSTPRAAGVASRVLLEARRAAGHLGGIRTVSGVPVMVDSTQGTVTNWQLRRALEQAAYVPTLAEYDPNLGNGYKHTPIVDAAPWLQVGWGELTADPAKGVVAETLAFLGYGEPDRTKAPGFCDFQTKVIEERHLYWDTVSPAADALIPDYVGGQDLDTGGDGAGAVEDPFIYCGGTLPSP